ncbi:MAG: MBL fold metallo-hydrolase [Myxococcota bacterium]
MDPHVDGVRLVAVRTPTLPPATHTNCWLVDGPDGLTVVDPASPWEDQQLLLFEALLAEIGAGRTVRRLFLTHHHHDHVSGAVDLRDRLAGAGHDVPIAAHPVTSALVAARGIAVDEAVADGEDLGGFVALHTPGHAPGHLALHHRTHGWVVAGDLVAGVGTIVLDPEEGDLQQYLDSLEQVRALSPSALLPAHGPVLPHAEAVLSFYVAHRHQRTEQVRAALDRAGRATPLELAPVVYPDVPTPVHLVAAAQIRTHLLWLAGHGRAREAGDGSWTPS